VEGDGSFDDGVQDGAIHRVEGEEEGGFGRGQVDEDLLVGGGGGRREEEGEGGEGGGVRGIYYSS